MTTRLRSKVKSPEHPRARGPASYAFLSRKELSLFRQLVDDRRSLPVYRAGGWLCYECPFEATDLAVMAGHIVRAHGAAPANEDDLDEDDSDLAYQACRGVSLLLVSARSGQPGFLTAAASEPVRRQVKRTPMYYRRPPAQPTTTGSHYTEGASFLSIKYFVATA